MLEQVPMDRTHHTTHGYEFLLDTYKASDHHFIREWVQVRAERAALVLHPFCEIAIQPVTKTRDKSPR